MTASCLIPSFGFSRPYISSSVVDFDLFDHRINAPATHVTPNRQTQMVSGDRLELMRRTHEPVVLFFGQQLPPFAIPILDTVPFAQALTTVPDNFQGIEGDWLRPFQFLLLPPGLINGLITGNPFEMAFCHLAGLGPVNCHSRGSSMPASVLANSKNPGTKIIIILTNQ